MSTTPVLGLALIPDGTNNCGNAERDTLTTIDTAIGSLRAEVAAIITPVASVFSRTGAVAAENGDYSFSQISGVVAPAQLTDVPAASVTGELPVAAGGTGAGDAVDARENLGVAASGVNDDITELTGLTTPLSIAQGGTGSSVGISGAVASVFGRAGVVVAAANDYSFSEISGDVAPGQLTNVPAASVTGEVAIANGGTGSTTAAAALAALGALPAATPVPIANGGTGSSTSSTARTALGAAAEGVNSDITELTALTVPLSIVQGGTGETTAAAALAALGGASAADVALLDASNTFTAPQTFSSIVLGAGSEMTEPTGNATHIATSEGSYTAGHLATWDTTGSSANIVDSGVALSALASTSGANDFFSIQNFIGGAVVNSSLQMTNPTAATSSSTPLPPAIEFLSYYWNGTSAQLGNWNIGVSSPSGANPTSQLQLTQSGSSGFASVAIPALELTKSVTASSATAGAASALPATPLTYVEIVIDISGTPTTVKIPVYSV